MGLVKCPECGKEISDMAQSCPNCGRPLVTQQGPGVNQGPNMGQGVPPAYQAPVQPQPPKKKGHGCLITVLIFVAIMILGVAFMPRVPKEDTGATEVRTVDVYDDVTVYNKISVSELVNKLGEPESKEEWTSETQKGSIPVESYLYDTDSAHYEYIVADDTVVGLSVYSADYWTGNGKKFGYKFKIDIVKQWGLKLGNDFKVVADTNYAYRIKKAADGIDDLWIQEINTDDKTYDIIKFTFDDNYL